MSRKMFFCLTVLCFLICASATVGYAQRPADAVARVPELDSFHEVIFKIWHEAWPKKNTAALRELLPDVEKGISQVAGARLPGILREKKAAWEDGVKKLQSAGEEYKAAAGAKDDAKLLAAAEQLHSRFEALMRVTRPALKELDEFHSVLYMLYHYHLPAYDIEKIRSSAAELKLKMAALNAASLPARLRAKESIFQTARAALSKSVDSLNAAVQSNDDKVIKAAISELHTSYQTLEAVF